MEYQKIINLFDNTLNQSRGRYDTNSQTEFKNSMLKSSLCDYSDAYILLKRSLTVPKTTAAGAAGNNDNKKVIFKNCTPFTDCLSKINNTQVHNAKDVDAITSKYNLIEYSNNYTKKIENFWQYYRDKPAVNDNGVNADFNKANVTNSFNFKVKITRQTDNNEIKFFLILTWSANCVTVSTAIAIQGTTFAKIDTKRYVLVVDSRQYKTIRSIKLE